MINDRYFVDEKPIWDEDQSLIIPGRTGNLVDDSVAQYTGGLIVVSEKFLLKLRLKSAL